MEASPLAVTRAPARKPTPVTSPRATGTVAPPRTLPVQRIVAAAPPPAPAQTQIAAPAPTGGARERRLELTGLVGIVVAAVALTGLILNYAAPWISQDADDPFAQDEDDTTSETVGKDRDEVQGMILGILPYTRMAIVWPALALMGAAAAGVTLLVLDLAVPHLKSHRGVAGVLFGMIGAAGFMLLLAAFRLLGAWISQEWSDQEVSFTFFESLHIVPFVNLALGLGLTAVGVWGVRQSVGSLMRAARHTDSPNAVKIAVLSMAVAGAALLLMPLLPFGSVEMPTGPNDEKSTLQATEVNLNFSQLSDDEDNEREPGEDVEIIRGSLWAVLLLSAFALVAAIAARSAASARLWTGLTHVYAWAAVPIVAGIIFTILFYLEFPDIASEGQDATITWNHFPALAFLALAGLYVWYVVSVAVPSLRGGTEPTSAPTFTPA